ncbi:MAG: cation-translocating P-type ATPase [Aquificota bacterium]|nr:cation-translocating P-type ATPase [Aquificota bacterium]
MRETLKVEGMSCVNCARTITLSLKKKEGVRDVKVSFELGRVWVDYDEERVTREEIVRAIEDLGYRVVEEEGKGDLQVLILSGLASFLILCLMIFKVPYSLYGQLFLSTLVQVIGGWTFYKGSYSSLRNGVANMDVLVALGTTGAYLYSLLTFLGLIPGSPFFETNALLITFVRGGRFIEERARKRATQLLKKLIGTQHSEVTLLEDGREVKKPVREVRKGEVFLCRAGDVVLLDGEVVKGSALVSEAVITGEPEPVRKKAGDKVVSGSVVEDGYIEVVAESIFEDSYLSKVSRIVDRALSEKPRIQRIVDRVSHYFVQGVIAIALITFFVWLEVGGNLQKAVQFSLAVLVISCPCALGIATPLAVAVGMSGALKRGILVKKPSVFEIVPRINLVVFDKTGTLTEGRFRVVRADLKDREALSIALSMEKGSNHPVARAIREFARERGAEETDLTGCSEIRGVGVRCGEYFIGESGSGNGEFKEVVLRKGEEVLAVFYLKDRIRKEAREVVKAVKDLGIKTFLLSGDRRHITEKVARDLGFDGFEAEVLPEGKKAKVEELQRMGYKVAMVGDGINDAPALARADLSFAVAQGTDMAKRTGDVVLLSGIRGVPVLLAFGRRVNGKIKQNLFWAFLYNTLGIPIAAGVFYKFGVFLKPEIAGLLMALSSVSVVLNTLTLTRRV